MGYNSVDLFNCGPGLHKAIHFNCLGPERFRLLSGPSRFDYDFILLQIFSVV